MSNTYFKYLHVDKVDQKWGVYITSLGFSKVEPNQCYPNTAHPHSHHLTWNKGRTLDDFYLVYITKGRGLFGSSKVPSTQILAGTCFLLYPGIWHRYKPDTEWGWEEYWVGFNGYYAKRLMAGDVFDFNKSLINIGLNNDILRLFISLMDVVRQGHVGYNQQLAGLTLQLLGHVHSLSRNLISDEGDPKRKLIDKARFMIQESFERNINMESLARQLPMGYSLFRKVFKEFTGESPNQYHLNIRLERAKQLLETTLLNISEIAFQTGFETVSYFSKLFKKRNGISPKTYRDSIE